MLQPAQIAIEECAQIIHPVFEHGKAIDSRAKGKALIFIRIEAARCDDARVDHAAAQHFHPAFGAPDDALAVDERVADINLRTRLGEGEIAGAQTQDDAARFAALGVAVQGVFGNLKFDATPDAAQLAAGRAWRAAAGRPVVMFASSREDEELALLHILKSFWAQSLDHPSSSAPDLIACETQAVQWLIVPRHPQRFDEVASLIESEGFTLSRRSRWGTQPDAAEIWLGDSLGEMALYYGLSDAALLGGSFAPLGGQNLIEAAACGCPVLMGPHTFNFSEAAELAQAAGAATRHVSLREAVEAVRGLVGNGGRQAAMAEAAGRFALAHRGATDRTVAAVLELVRP